MLAKAASYVIAFVVLAGIELPFFPVTMALSIALKKVKWAAPCFTLVFDAFKICCGVLLAAWLDHKIGQSPSWLMFLVPGYLMVQNNMMRINRVKAGRSNVKRILEQRGEPGSYDQRHDLWVERGHLWGDVAGWIIGTSLVRPSTFF